MIVPTLAGVLSICISLALTNIRSSSVRLAASFVPIFLFLAFRYQYGNDYAAYFDMFEDVAVANSFSFDSSEWHAEIGWIFLNRIFSSLGFFSLIFFLAMFNCWAYARFLNKFVPPEYYWVSIFLYVFSPDNMLVQASAMRQAVSIAIFLISLEFLVEKKLVKYFVLIALAASFHSSALLLAPVALLSLSGSRGGWKWSYLSAPIYVSLFFFSDIIFSLLQQYVNSSSDGLFSERYAVYDEKGSIGSGIGAIFQGSYLFVLLWFYSKQRFDSRILFRIAVISVCFIPLAVAVQMFARVGSYFTVVSIATVPLILSHIRHPALKFSFLILYMGFVAWSFLGFFESPVYQKGFSEYKTILEY